MENLYFLKIIFQKPSEEGDFPKKKKKIQAHTVVMDFLNIQLTWIFKNIF